MRWMIGMMMMVAAAASAFAQNNRMRAELGQPRSAQEVERQLSVQAPAGQAMQVSVALQVPFEFGSARLTFEGMRVLDVVALALNSPSLAEHVFLIEGHTDSVGSDVSNLQLSKARAQSAYEYLVMRGVSAYRLNTAGYGELRPIPGTFGEDPRNRRVEIVRLP